MHDLLLKNIRVNGKIPAHGDKAGSISYAVTFAIKFDEMSSNQNDIITLDVAVSTAEGYSSAAALACRKLAEYGQWLHEQAHHEVDGPSMSEN